MSKYVSLPPADISPRGRFKKQVVKDLVHVPLSSDNRVRIGDLLIFEHRFCLPNALCPAADIIVHADTHV